MHFFLKVPSGTKIYSKMKNFWYLDKFGKVNKIK